jgi:hypothetical protein
VKESLSLHRYFSFAVLLMGVPAFAQTQQATLTQTPNAPAQPALRLDIPHSDNPFNAYRATLVPQPNLANSPRVDTLVNNGELELSQKDANALA